MFAALYFNLIEFHELLLDDHQEQHFRKWTYPELCTELSVIDGLWHQFNLLNHSKLLMRGSWSQECGKCHKNYEWWSSIHVYKRHSCKSTRDWMQICKRFKVQTFGVCNYHNQFYINRSYDTMIRYNDFHQDSNQKWKFDQCWTPSSMLVIFI